MRRAKISNVHPSEHNFFGSGRHGLFSLIQGFGHSGTPRTASRQWNGAKRAEIVAAILDLQERPGSVPT